MEIRKENEAVFEVLYCSAPVPAHVTQLECSFIRIASEMFYSKYNAQGGMNWKAEIKFILRTHIELLGILQKLEYLLL